MASATVTVSDIIDLLNLPNARRTKDVINQFPVQPAVTDAILVEKVNENEISINPQSLATILNEEPKTGQNSRGVCHRLCYQSKDVSSLEFRENPASFLSQKRFNTTSLGRSVTLDDFGKRSINFEGKSAERNKRNWLRFDEDDSLSPSYASSSALTNSVDSDRTFLRRWKSFVYDMGAILSPQGENLPQDWDPDEKTSAEDLDDPLNWLRRSPVKNRFDTRSRGALEEMTEGGDTPSYGAARSSDLDHDGGRSGIRSGVPGGSAVRRPGKYFVGDHIDDEVDRPRRERINFRLIAAQLFRPKRSIVAVAPKTYDPSVYAFPSPLSEAFGSLDLVSLSREGRDWRVATDARPKDPTEERILDRLLCMIRLEDETVEMENAEKVSRGSQCRNCEQPLKQTKTPASVNKDCFSVGRSEVRSVRGLERQIYRLSMERTGLEKSARFRKTESKDDSNCRRQPSSQTPTASRKSQPERHESSFEQLGSRLILASIQPNCEKLVRVTGHQLTSDDPDQKKNKREKSSGRKVRAGDRKPNNGRLTMTASGKPRPSPGSVSFADQPKPPRSTKQKSSSSSSATTTTTTSSSSKTANKQQSSKKRPRTAV